MPARSYVAGHFQLLLEGVKSGFLKSVDGGAAVAEVISESIGSSYFTKKHIGQVKYGPLVLQFGLSMGNDLYKWINASWTGNYSRKNGAVVAADHQFEAVSQREFFNALITETTIPKLDGSSKNPAYLTLKVAPEYTRVTKASGKVTGGIAKGEQKLWLPSNFRVTIDGLDCQKVSAVESFTVKQSVATDDVGEARDYLREPTRLEFPHLEITLPESSAKGWFDWFTDFVIKGNNDETKEKQGSIVLLSANFVDELLRIDLFNLGIFRIGVDRAEANSDRLTTVTAHLYCDRMELRPAGAAAPKTVKVPRAAGARRARGKRQR
jgi:phage tail-like protein